MHPGQWEVKIIPENQPALNFWRKVVASYTAGHFLEEIKTVDCHSGKQQRIILTFASDTRP